MSQVSAHRYLEDSIYKDYIYEMAEKGIIKGYSSDCFGFEESSKCLLTKNENVAKGTEVVIRKDLEDAVLELGWAYFAKDAKIQYDSTHLTDVNGRSGGIRRISSRSAPEFATEDRTLFSVCSGYVDLVYYDALDTLAMGEVNTLVLLQQAKILHIPLKLKINKYRRDCFTCLVRQFLQRTAPNEGARP